MPKKQQGQLLSDQNSGYMLRRMRIKRDSIDEVTLLFCLLISNRSLLDTTKAISISRKNGKNRDMMMTSTVGFISVIRKKNLADVVLYNVSNADLTQNRIISNYTRLLGYFINLCIESHLRFVSMYNFSVSKYSP